MGQSTGDLFKEVSAFWRYPLVEGSQYYNTHIHKPMSDKPVLDKPGVG